MGFQRGGRAAVRRSARPAMDAEAAARSRAVPAHAQAFALRTTIFFERFCDLLMRTDQTHNILS